MTQSSLNVALLSLCASVCVLLSQSACSSDSSSAADPSPCGAGTVKSADGTCVAQCGAGTTLENGQCVVGAGAGGTGGVTAAGGNGVGAGGTTAASGSGGQPSGGTSGVGGTGQAGSAAGGPQGGAPAGGAGGTSAMAGSAGSAGWGDPLPGDDPCPDHIDLNCSDSCGPKSPLCAQSTCALGANSLAEPVHIPPTLGTSFVIRLPSHPGTDPDCTALCPAGPVFGLAFRMDTPPGDKSPPFVKISAASPWAWSDGNYVSDFCAKAVSKCLATSATGDIEIFVTSNPDVPARNITYQFTSSLGVCP